MVLGGLWWFGLAPPGILSCRPFPHQHQRGLQPVCSMLSIIVQCNACMQCIESMLAGSHSIAVREQQFGNIMVPACADVNTPIKIIDLLLHAGPVWSQHCQDIGRHQPLVRALYMDACVVTLGSCLLDLPENCGPLRAGTDVDNLAMLPGRGFTPPTPAPAACAAAAAASPAALAAAVAARAALAAAAAARSWASRVFRCRCNASVCASNSSSCCSASSALLQQAVLQEVSAATTRC